MGNSGEGEMGNADGFEWIQIEKLKLTSISTKLYITSLNSHFWPKHPCPKVWWLDLKRESVD
jgi:hypothetical protein